MYIRFMYIQKNQFVKRIARAAIPNKNLVKRMCVCVCVCVCVRDVFKKFKSGKRLKVEL